MRAVFPQFPVATLTINRGSGYYGATFDAGRKRLAGSIIGVLGILLMFPLALSLVCAGVACSETGGESSHPSPLLTLLETAACAFVAVWTLAVIKSSVVSSHLHGRVPRLCAAYRRSASSAAQLERPR